MYDKNTSSSKQMQTLWAKRTVAVSLLYITGLDQRCSWWPAGVMWRGIKNEWQRGIYTVWVCCWMGEWSARDPCPELIFPKWIAFSHSWKLKREKKPTINLRLDFPHQLKRPWYTKASTRLSVQGHCESLVNFSWNKNPTMQQTNTRLVIL